MIDAMQHQGDAPAQEVLEAFADRCKGLVAHNIGTNIGHDFAGT